MKIFVSLFLATSLTSLSTIINAGIFEDNLKRTFLKVISNALSITTTELEYNLNNRTSEKRLLSLIKSYQIGASVYHDGIYDPSLSHYSISRIKRLNDQLAKIDANIISEETRALLTTCATVYNRTLTSFAPADTEILLPPALTFTHTENSNDDYSESSVIEKEFDASIKNIFWKVISKALNQRQTTLEEEICTLDTDDEIHLAIKSYHIDALVLEEGIYGSLSCYRSHSIKRFEKEYLDIDPGEIHEDTEKLFTTVTNIYNKTLIEDYLTEDCTFNLEPKIITRSQSKKRQLFKALSR
jgi:hypothetical protein